MTAPRQDVGDRLRAAFERLEGEDATSPLLVVWDDPEGEFADALDELVPEGVELLRDDDGARFAAKRRLNALRPGERALLYRRRAVHDVAGDWFADAVLYATHFQADLASARIEELGCADTREVRDALRELRPFLARRSNVRRLHALRPSYATANELLLAAMALALGAGEPEWYYVLARYLSRARAEGAEAPLADLEAAGVVAAFDRMVSEATGYDGDVADADALCAHVLLTALADCLDVSELRGLERNLSVPHARLCHELVRAWAASGDADELRAAARELEESRNLRRRLASLGAEVASRVDFLPCAHEVVASSLLRSVAAGDDVRDLAARVTDARRAMPWFGGVRSYYDAVAAACELRRLRREHADGLGAASPAELWEAYVGGLWRVDAAYRAFRTAYAAALARPNLELDDDLKAAAERVEDLYGTWFLDGLNVRWMDLAAPDFAAQGYAGGVPRSRDFFASEVEPVLSRGDRLFVVVSDALRYEVAAELAERLERETQGRADLASMQAPFPSVTPTGMAALLPHGSFELTAAEGRPSVLVDGLPARTTRERQEALRRRVPGVVCVRYEDLVAMRRDERRALVADAPVTYVFHDAIDAVGDDAKTEDDVFDACRDAVDELVGLVRVITRELRVSNVVVTADHGFLYAGRVADALGHVEAPQLGEASLAESRRWVLARAGAIADGLDPVAMTANGAPGMVGLTPHGCARIRRPGAGERYVHGGLSLQELCVPVLRFKNLRSNAKAYVEAEPVEVRPVHVPDPIAATAFRLRLLQAQPVGGKRLPAEYEVLVEDASGNPVSDVWHVAADRTSPEDAERELEGRMGLLAGADLAGGAPYAVVCRAAGTGEVCWRREVRIEVAFAPVEDFGW